MSMHPRLTSRSVLKPFGFCALLALTLLAGNRAEAQAPAVLTYGARYALTIPPAAGTGNPGKAVRDGQGDIFVVGSANAIVEYPVNGPAQVVVPSTDPSMINANAGFTPRLAADAAGNLFVEQYTYSFSGVLYEIPRNANGTYGTGVVVGTGLSAAFSGYFYQPSDIAADASDNIFVAVGTKGILEINTNTSNTVGSNGRLVVGPLTNGANSVALDTSGDLFYADGAAVWEITAASLATASPTPIQIGATSAGSCAGCVALSTPKTLFTDLGGNVYVGNGTQWDVIVNTVSGFSTSSPTYVLPGTVTGHTAALYGAVNNNGDFFLTYNGAFEYYGAGSVFLSPTYATGAASSTTGPSGPSVGLLFTQPTTVASYAVVNSNAANGGAGLPQVTFNTGSNTTCAAQAYTAGQSCNIELGYAVRGPGAMTGTLVVYGTAGNILASVNVYAVGTGAALALDSVAPTTIGTGYANPGGIAIDGSGAAYIADSTANTVLKYAAGSTTTGTSIATGLSSPSGVALDQADNVYIADTGNNRIVVVPNYSTGLSTANQFVLTVSGYTLSAPRGIAVDNFGDIVIADSGNGRVLEVGNPFSSGLSKPTIVASGLTTPTGIAFDAYNNMFIADKGANAVYEVAGSMIVLSGTANVGSGILASVGSGFSAPTGVATDATGSVYVTDSGNARIVKVPSVAGVLTTSSQTVLYSGLNKPYGIATDFTGDLYYTDQNAPGVYLALRSTANGGKTGFLNFGSVAVNSTTNLTSTISNVGLTTSLAISAIATPAAPVTLGAASTNPCSATPTLAPGTGCNLLLVYNPTATGATAASFNVTDNALGVTAVTQGIHYEGTVSGAVASATLTGPASVIYGDNATYTLSAFDSSNNPAVAGNGTYTVAISGSTKTATVTLNGGTGTFFLPSLGVGSYTLSTTVSGFAASIAVSVTKAPLTVAAGSFSRIFDQANPAVTISYSGFGNGDTVASLSGTPPVASTTATRISNAGTYPVTLTGSTLSSANYTITLVNGTATVGGAAPQTILFPKLPNYSSTANSTVTLTGTATSGLPLTYTVSGPATVSGSVLTITGTGAITVTAAQAGNGNYAAATPVARSFTAQ